MMSPASSIGAGGLARMVTLRVRLAQGLTGFAVVAGSMGRNAPSVSRHRGTIGLLTGISPWLSAKLVVFPEFVSQLSDASLLTQISEARSVGILGTNLSASSLFSQ